MSADEYRRYARECFQIAEITPDSRHKFLLIDMAQSWMLLAQQAEKNSTTDLVYETPREGGRPAVAQQQQQQQIPPKKQE